MNNNISYMNSLDFDDVPEKMIEYQLLCGTSSETNKFQSPVKLYEYMASGVPILYADNPQVIEILDGNQKGTLFSIGNPSDIERKIIDIYNNYSICVKKASIAREYVIDNHTWLSRVNFILKDHL